MKTDEVNNRPAASGPACLFYNVLYSKKNIIFVEGGGSDMTWFSV